MSFEAATVTLVGGEISVLEYRLERIVRDIRASRTPDRAEVYESILEKITAAKTEVE